MKTTICLYTADMVLARSSWIETSRLPYVCLCVICCRLKKTQCPAAMLWGCSSGALTRYGIHDPNGTAVAYLLGGAPWIMGNLWDVTDKDIDKLSMVCMEKLLGNSDDAATSLRVSRRECKLKFANGCAAVIYGLPDDVITTM